MIYTIRETNILKRRLQKRVDKQLKRVTLEYRTQRKSAMLNSRILTCLLAILLWIWSQESQSFDRKKHFNFYFPKLFHTYLTGDISRARDCIK
jgi:hypothetical protein